MSGEDNNEVYNNLTEAVNPQKTKDKWTLYLFLAALIVSSASFVFGYNIGVTNLPTPLIKDFFAQRYYNDFYLQNKEYEKALRNLQVNQDDYANRKAVIEAAKSAPANTSESSPAKREAEEQPASTTTVAATTIEETTTTTTVAPLDDEEYFKELEEKIKTQQADVDEKFKKIEEPKKQVDEFNTFLWTITTTLFVVGGAIGAFTSKFVVDGFGRKKGIIFHHAFTVVGAVLVIISRYLVLPELILVSRLLFGIQGGMSCGLVPTYLSEISPVSLRGETGIMHQLFITVGILVSQILGFRQVLGTENLWHFLLGLPIVPAIIGALLLLLLFPETPRALLLNNRDEEKARIALQRFRNRLNVNEEIDQINQEARETKSDEAISMKELFTLKELRWPLITGLVIQLAQQLCGINAIFFYSESIFRAASIKDEHIQYAVFFTGFINVVTTIIAVFLIDKLGRKPLLVYPMIVIILDFILLTVFMILRTTDIRYSYLSIACIGVFIVCFAIGLGPIPFIYVAECFRQDARSAALAVCMAVNWLANFVLTLTFPYLAKLLTNYVFLVFTVIVAFSVAFIFKKVPETKGRSTEEIMAHFEGRKRNQDEASGKLMGNTNV